MSAQTEDRGSKPDGSSQSADGGVAATCSGSGAGLLYPFANDGTWTLTIPASDDGSFGPVNFPFTFTLFGASHTKCWVNNNGNLTFTAPYSEYTPSGFPVSGPIMVAGFWADIDTRPAASGKVWRKLVASGGDGVIDTLVVTWDNVGRYDQLTDLLNTFQIVITDGSNPLVGVGQNVAFSYDNMCWATFGGTGFGTPPATVGANKGNGIDFFQIGRFGQNNDFYDGPAGQNDGIDFLDGKVFVFDATQGNVAPIAEGMPPNGLYTIDTASSDPLDATILFLSPENNQTTSISVVDVDGAQAKGLVVETVPGNPATLSLDWSPECSDYGIYHLQVTATDNFATPAQTTVNLTIDVGCSNAPDLIAANIVTPPTAFINASVVVEWTVQNVGGLEALAGSTTQVFRSPDAIIGNGNDTFVASVEVPQSIGAGAGLTQSVAVPMPANVSDQWIIVRVDSEDVVEEATHEDNNVSVGAAPISVIFPPAPDLVTAISAGPTQGLTEQSFQVSWTTTNSGPVAASGTWSDRVFLSSDAVFGNGNDTALGSPVSFSGTVAPGDSYTRTQIYNFPTTPGTYWLFARTDVNGQVTEYNGESNNVSAPFGSITVLQTPKPDLIVTGVIAPTSGILSGTTTKISYTVKNVGTGPTTTPTWNDVLVLTPTSSLPQPPLVLGANTQVLGSFTNPQYLQPGESYSQTVFVSLPHDIIGSYHICAYADCNPNTSINQIFAVTELSETNNFAFSPSFQIELEPQPDLVVSQIDMPSTVFSGQNLTVTWTETNNGKGITDSGQWSHALFLSTNNDPQLTAGDIPLVTTFTSIAPLAQGQSANFNATKLLPLNLSGLFHVKVIADASNVISELGGESNNLGVSVGTVNVVLSAAPDLVPTTVATAAPQTVYPGYPATVSWSVVNDGAPPLAAQSWSDTIYLSTDNTLGPGDVEVASDGASTSSSGGDLTIAPYSRTRTFTVPPSLPQGTYFAIVRVDDENQLFEGPCADDCEHNNVKAATVPFIVEQKYANLVATVSGEPPTTAAVGTSVNIGWQIANDGELDTNTTTWVDRVYLSTNATLGGNDTFLGGEIRTKKLVPGESYSKSKTVEIPFVVPGTYFLLVVTDTDDVVIESSNSDNVFATSVTVTAVLSDLVVPNESVSVTQDGSAGGQATANWMVKNQGFATTNVASWVDRIYLSNDTTWSGDDIPVGAKTHSGPLAASESYGTSLVFSIPSSLGGDFHLVVRTDADGQVTETNESNNTSVAGPAGGKGGGGEDETDIEIDPIIPSNLVVTAVTRTDAGTSGQTLSLTWTVENIGPGPTVSPNWTDGFYLSLDQFLDTPGDTYVGGIPHAGALAPGESYTTTSTVTVPFGVAGPFFLIAYTDVGGNIPESLEGDNWRSTTALTIIELPPPADLVVEAVSSVAPAIQLGAPAQFSRTISNVGEHPVTGNWKDSIYLSTDSQWSLEDRLIGTFVTSSQGTMDPGESVTQIDSATVPGVTPGPYYLITRTDVFNSIGETNEDNNLGSSAGPVQVEAIHIELNQPYAGVLSEGQFRYYQFDAPAGETVRVSFDHQSPTAFTEVYVRFGQAPTLGQFDFLFSNPGFPHQEVLIPTTVTGTYYVLARVTAGAPAPAGPYTILAETIPFEVSGISPNFLGTGVVTVDISGSRFEPATVFRLRKTGGGPIAEGELTTIFDATSARVRFDLSGYPLGQYDVVAVNNRDVVSLDNAVTVDVPLPLSTSVEILNAAAIRKGTSQNRFIRIENTSNVDIPFAVVAFGVVNETGVNIAFTLGEDTQSLPAVGPLAFTQVLYRDLPPGLPNYIPVTLGITTAYPLGEIGMSAQCEVFSRDQFRDGPFRTHAIKSLQRISDSEEVQDLPDEIRTPLVQFLADEDGALEAVLADFDSIMDAETPGEGGTAANDGIGAGFCAVSCLWGTFELCAPVCVKLMVIPGWGQAACGAVALVCSTVVLQQCISCCIDPCSSSCLIITNAAAGCEDPKPPSCPAPNLPTAGGGGSSGGQPPVGEGGIAGGSVIEPDGDKKCNPCTQAPDPNEKTGPTGYGFEGWITATDQIPYHVYFENIPEATASAARVEIRDPLHPSLNAGSFRVGDIYIGDLTIVVPPNKISYQTTIDLTEESGVLVDIIAGVDASKTPPEAFWILQAIDPETGEAPLDAFAGFLPPNNENGDGQGRVEFSIYPKLSTPTGTVVTNDAEIVFDVNEPIITNEVHNAIDADAPSSSLAPLAPVVPGPLVTLVPSGSDPVGGSGLEGFTLLASKDGGPLAALGFADLLTPAPSFPIEESGVYGFASRARDNAGNQESIFGPTQFSAIPSVELDESSDTGTVGDGVTYDSTPTFIVVSAPLTDVTVEVFGPSPRSAVVQTGVNGRGVLTIDDREALADGEYVVSATAFAVEVTTSVIIDTLPPAISGWSAIASHDKVGETTLAIGSTSYSESRQLTETLVRLNLSRAEAKHFEEVAPTGATIFGRDALENPVDLSKHTIKIVARADLNAYEVAVSPALPDRAVYCITVEGMSDLAGNEAAESDVRRIYYALQGDVTGDGRVTVTDVGGLISLVGTDPVNGSDVNQVRSDIDRNGQIEGDESGTTGDLAFVTSALGVDLRFVAAPCPVPVAGSGLPGTGFGGPPPIHVDPTPTGGHILAGGPVTNVTGTGGLDPTAPVDGGAVSGDPQPAPDPTLPKKPTDAPTPKAPWTESDRFIAIFDPTLRVDSEQLFELAGDVALIASIEPMPLPGWTFVTFAEEADGNAVDQWSESVADAGAFVSPVKTTATGDLVIVTHLLVARTRDLGARELGLMLATVDPGATIVHHDPQGMVTISLSARNSSQVVAAAAQLEGRQGILWIEPDALFTLTSDPAAMASAVNHALRSEGLVGVLSDSLRSSRAESVMLRHPFAPQWGPVPDGSLLDVFVRGIGDHQAPLAVAGTMVPWGESRWLAQTVGWVEAIRWLKAVGAEPMIVPASTSYRSHAIEEAKLNRVSRPPATLRKEPPVRGANPVGPAHALRVVEPAQPPIDQAGVGARHPVEPTGHESRTGSKGE